MVQDDFDDVFVKSDYHFMKAMKLYAKEYDIH
jgi:hypothetical protein